MIATIVLGLLTIFTLYYIYFVIRVHLGLNSLQPATSTNFFPTASIVISARNEEKFIQQCLESLVQQTYPSDKYEIIVVDDGSTDKTADLVTSFSKRYTNIYILSLPVDNIRRTGRKPFAISKGVAQAKGEIILSTDADCIVPERWIEIMVSHFKEGVVLVAGPVTEQTSHSVFSRLEQLEFLGLITTAAGLIGSGRPIICNGANLAYRKSAFHSAGGFGDSGTSNDDESLMNKMVHRKIGNVVFAPEADAIVQTSSSNTILSFMHQRIRWANKRGHYEDRSILVTLVSLYLFFLSLAVAFVLIPYDPQLLLPFAIAFGCKIVVDYFTLRAGSRLFRQRITAFHFIIAELFHVPYIVFAAAIGQLASIRWKGRIFRR